MPRPATVTLQQVAEELQISERTAYRRVKDGSIPAFKMGSMWRCSASYLDELRGVPTIAPSTGSHTLLLAEDQNAEEAPAPARFTYKM
jgi:excisionase family DNA binding protein